MKVIATILCLALMPTPVWATEPAGAEAAAAEEAPRRKVMEVDGQRGVWFRDDVVEKIMKDKELLLEHEKALKQAEAAIVAQEEVEKACRAALGYSQESEELARTNLETALRRAREAEEDRDGVLAGKPAVWLGVGLLASLALAVVVDKIQE